MLQFASWVAIYHVPILIGGALLLGLVTGLLARVLLQQLRHRNSADRVANASEAKFRTCFDNLADGVLVLRVEQDGRLVYEEANGAAETLLGISCEATRGRTPMEVWPSERAAYLEARIWQCIAEDRPVTYARAHVFPDGLRKLCMTLAPVHDENGRVCRVIKTIADVTEREHLEEQLRRAQKMEAIGRLTAGIAHDFNNLLQAQAGSLELLLDEVEDMPAASEYAGIAMAATERAAELTHHLLAFAGKQVLLPEPVPVSALLVETGEAIGRLIGPHIDVEILCEGEVPAAFADRAQLRMTLLNLAFNARDAMPRGGKLRVSARAAFVPSSGAPEGLGVGNYVVVSVIDTGTGMDPQTLERACDPFFSTKGALVSGLGLSMVQGFARQSAGEMHIVSAPGLGTRIDIWLPCAAFGASAEARVVAHAGPGPHRVLLVDDSPDVLLTTGAFLEGAGFDVMRANSGDRALVVLAAGERFDALVTDYAMPSVNGAELILQALHLQPSLAALIITGFAEVSGLETLPGQVQVLRKPFRRDELIRRLQHVITRRPTPAEVA